MNSVGQCLISGLSGAIATAALMRYLPPGSEGETLSSVIRVRGVQLVDEAGQEVGYLGLRDSAGAPHLILRGATEGDSVEVMTKGDLGPCVILSSRGERAVVSTRCIALKDLEDSLRFFVGSWSLWQNQLAVPPSTSTLYLSGSRGDFSATITTSGTASTLELGAAHGAQVKAWTDGKSASVIAEDN